KDHRTADSVIAGFIRTDCRSSVHQTSGCGERVHKRPAEQIELRSAAQDISGRKNDRLNANWLQRGWSQDEISELQVIAWPNFKLRCLRYAGHSRIKHRAQR